MTSIYWTYYHNDGFSPGHVILDIDGVRIGGIALSESRWQQLKMSLQTPYNSPSRLIIKESTVGDVPSAEPKQTKPTESES